MKISIITIVLNDVEHIEKTLLSIINQNIQDLEYIVIDGESSDGTLEIINKYKNRIDIFISEKDNGITDAFNKGVDLSTGDIVGIVNSGDFLEAGALKKVQIAFNEGIEVVYGNVQYWKTNQKGYIYKANHKLLSSFMSINHPSVFVKKEVYTRLGLFSDDYKIAMDYDLMLRFYINNVKFKYINTLLSNMALGGLSDINWRQAYKEAYQIRRKYMGSSISIFLSYIFQVSKRYISNLLSVIGLGYLKEYYRSNISLIKKEK